MSETAPVVHTDSSYDDVPYESSSFPQTHPDRLATLATLFGLAPASVERCSVLELGCAMGANLVPMAFNLPGSRFVGVDLSARQVAAARASAAELGLTNIRIEHASILDVDASWGSFDYVICHGVFSWVPRHVQDQILAIAANNLTPHGVAFISYNTYPGWHIREMVRHMMRYHSSQFENIPERIEQARALIDFLAGAVDTSSYYGALLQDELTLVHRARDSYLYHEHLEEVNDPLYFHEFVGRAARHGLQYLAEAEFTSMLPRELPDASVETLERISPDIVRAEQYLDFLRNRFFRQTLLCAANLAVNRQLTADSLRGLLLASPVVPDASTDAHTHGFMTPEGRRISTEFPLTRAALSVLGECWPLALDQPTLRARAIDRLDATAGADADRAWDIVLDDLLHCFASGAVELRTWQAPFVHRVTRTPQVSRLAAQHASAGNLVVSQRHEPVTLDAIGRHVVTALTTARDRERLHAELLQRMQRGELVIHDDGDGAPGEDRLRQLLEAAVDEALAQCARRALLVR